MKILIVSQWYDPEPIPKPSDLAIALKERGHEVRVLTGFPHYPTGRLPAGYRLMPWQRETRAGIPVLRVFEVPYHGSNGILRAINYTSFLFSALLAGLFIRKPDLIYTWNPPPTAGLAGALIGRLKGASTVHDVQDVWPAEIEASGLHLPRFASRILERLERFLYHNASRLIVVTEGSRVHAESLGVEPDRIAVLPHWIDEIAFAAAPQHQTAAKEEHDLRGRFVVMFAGNMGLIQGLDIVIQAAARLPQDGPLIVLVGDGVALPALQAETKRLGLSNVRFMGRRPSNDMPSIMAAADALLLTLKGSDASEFIIPTKLISYLAAGRPVITSADGAAAELTTQSGGGLVTPPQDADALAQTILALATMDPAERAAMGARGREFLLANMTKRHVLDQYIHLLEDAEPKRSTRGAGPGLPS